MKLTSLCLASALLASTSLAAPNNEPELQAVFDGFDFNHVAHEVADTVVTSSGRKNVFDKAKKLASDATSKVRTAFKDGALRDFVESQGIAYELYEHPAYKDHSLRITEPDICDPNVQQYSGYLDITDGKHLFFWFFESRLNPADAPLVLWLNGGPGCSSSTGLLFELGPCRVENEGKNVSYNPHSWTSQANIIFLDQPVNVGYSYSDDGSQVSTSPLAGEDVYAFLQLFLQRYPKYADTPFHLAAESYGGTYVPNFASVIHKKNKELAVVSNKDAVKINLESMIIGNGQTNTYIQHASIPTFACEGPFPIYDDPNGAECQSLRSKVPTCQRLIASCQKYNSRLTCVPAAMYCNSQLIGPIQQTGLNPYDVRRTCNPETDTSLCYKQMGWIETWMNDPSNKKAVGANPSVDFQSCNMQVNQAFMMQGDGFKNHALLLPEIINDGVRLLIYAGNADFMCNFIGNEQWLEKLETKFNGEFQQAEKQPWITLDGGKIAGQVRTAGATELTAGNVTYVEVYDAGHMVPYDQPEAALDLFTRWIFDTPLAN